jgi:transposase-like protein
MKIIKISESKKTISDKKVKQIIKLTKERKHVEDIATEVGVSSTSVRTYARKWFNDNKHIEDPHNEFDSVYEKYPYEGMSARVSQRQIKRIVELTKKQKAVKDIAFDIGVTDSIVRYHAKRWFNSNKHIEDPNHEFNDVYEKYLPEGMSARVSQKQIERIIELTKKQKAVREIANDVGITSTSVKAFARKWFNDNKHIEDPNNEFNDVYEKYPPEGKLLVDEQKKRIVDLTKERKHVEDIATEVGVSSTSVRTYARKWFNDNKHIEDPNNDFNDVYEKYPYEKKYFQLISDEQISQIIELTKKQKPVKDIAMDIGFRRQTVKDHARKWFNDNKHIEDPNNEFNDVYEKYPYEGMRGLLNDEQIKRIVELTKKSILVQDIATEVGVSPGSVRTYARKWFNDNKHIENPNNEFNDVYEKYPYEGFVTRTNDEQISQIISLTKKMKNVREIALDVGVTKTAVRYNARKWFNDNKHIEDPNHEFNDVYEKYPPERIIDYPSVHVSGGQSASMHEAIIRDVFYFTGLEFSFQPKSWISLPFVKSFIENCFAEAKDYNEGTGYKFYERSYPQPDFLINNSLLYEVFGGARRKEEYEHTERFKKEKFNKFFGSHFAYIEKKDLDQAAKNDRSLVSYAKALDSRSCSDKNVCGPDILGHQFEVKINSLVTLLDKNNISVVHSYIHTIKKLKEGGQLDRARSRLEQRLHWDNEKVKTQQSPTQEALGQEPIHFPQSASHNWYKLAQASGNYSRTEPVSMDQIVQGLREEGFWTPHLWSEQDQVAMYFKTPENLQMALSKMQNQQEVMEFPQEEQEVAAFNLSKFKKEARFFHDQTYSDDEGTYKVPDIFNYAKKHEKIKKIPISKLLHNLDPSPHESGDELPGSPEFIERAKKADLSYPIVVVKYPDGWFIADGVHRLWKAKDEGLKSMRGYVIDHTELEEL